MDFVGFPKIPRYSRECVITEKIDGTNGQILIVEDGEMFVGNRYRWLSADNDNFGLFKWAMENKDELLKLGMGRHFGEWWGQGINRGYGIKEKRFSLFNVHRWSDPEVRPECCHVVPVILTGHFDYGVVNTSLKILATYGSWASPGFMNPEGIVIFHKAGNFLFKKTLRNDEKPKGMVEE